MRSMIDNDFLEELLKFQKDPETVEFSKGFVEHPHKLFLPFENCLVIIFYSLDDASNRVYEQQLRIPKRRNITKNQEE